ncbi:MAG: hypothetical protein GX051_09200 [Clostridiales bacterium]|nr:hypothetical protein [Clostridiales bacterium]
MNTVLALICASAFSLNSLSIRFFQLKLMRVSRDVKLFQFLFCAVASCAYMLAGGFVFTLTPRDILLAASFGILFAVCILASAECYVCGPMSVTSVIMNSSVVVPVIYSCAVLHESISVTQIIGLMLLIATFVILSGGSKKSNGISARWFILVLISFFANGSTAVIQKVYKLSAAPGGGYDFMGVAYAIAALAVFAAFAADKRKAESGKGFSSAPLFVVLVLVAGLGSFCGNGMLLNLSTVMPASLLYPLMNGALCIIVAAVSLLVFREKVTPRKLSAIACGLGAIIVLNL